MHILIIEDNPEFKIFPALEYIKNKNIDFSYELVKNTGAALRYIDKFFNIIDLAIIDLGLPLMYDGCEYNELNGLIALNRLLYRNKNIPIIINSTTKIAPDEEAFLKRYRDDNAVIHHVDCVDGIWLLDFITNTL